MQAMRRWAFWAGIETTSAINLHLPGAFRDKNAHRKSMKFKYPLKTNT
jgi:hypothetical protein